MNENTNPSPPKTALRLLSWFCPDYLYEEIEGDLIQKFNKDVRKKGRNYALRHKPVVSLMPLYMLTNYFKIALRIMVRNKGYSMINILGLAFGLTGAVLLGLWIKEEFSYDQFHTDKERIYMAWNKQR
jgi:putative ABC transport system permease protein